MSSLANAKLFDVSSLVCVVTGGGTGIGLMITETLAQNGSRVYITGRRKEKLDSVVSSHQDLPGRIIALPGDITSKADLERMAESVSTQEPNGIHLLVNNAGIVREEATKFAVAGKPDHSDVSALAAFMWKSEPQKWAETFETNVSAQYFTSVAFLPLLARGRQLHEGYSPSIVNLSSVVGAMKGSNNGQWAYAASKAAFLQLTRSLATTFLDASIRVNCIAPWLFPSEMTIADRNETTITGRDPGNPANRFGEAKDMGACILLLAGPGGTFLNGQVLYPDGGLMLVHGSTA